ncbi:MAG TPA: mandelate racemase/muconate lactonizing enzyme family protein [Bryobacterales bacterium]|nr:mandelate racemase/muconate lactonizing enzyme family protein [Bryobacterales bacterium]
MSNTAREASRRQFLQTVAAGILGTGVRVGAGLSAVSAWSGAQTNSVLNHAKGAGGSPLRIRKVDPCILRLRLRGREGYYLMCRIQTDDGLVGWGEGTNFPKVATIATEIEMLKPFVIGQSAWDIEKIWYTLYRGRNAMHGSAVQSAISAIDIALWDIVAQRLNVPVYKLLGGKVSERIKIYTSYRWGNIPRTAEAYAKRTRELVSEGAIAGKWDPFFDEPYTPGMRREERLDFSHQALLKTINEVAEMVRGIREGGPEFEICVEAHAKFNVASAVRIAKAIEPYNPMFLEEPVPPENPDAMIQVQRATSIPIAAGERLKSRLEAREYIERDAFRIYQPDVSRAGGITEFRKLVAMAENHFIPVAPHNPNGPVCLAAHLHLSAAMADFLILEEGETDPALNRELFGEWHDSRAYFLPPEGPGLGLQISDALLREHAVDLDKAAAGLAPS